MTITTQSDKWWMLVALAMIGGLLYLLAPVLTPFVISALLAYLANPLVNRLVVLKLTRTVATVIVFLIMMLIVLLIPALFIPLLEKQLSVFLNAWPGYVDWFQNIALPWLQAHIGVAGPSFDLSELKQAFSEYWSQMGGLAKGLARTVSHSSMVLLAWLANLVLIPVVTFYLLRDWDKLMRKLRELLPRSIEGTIVNLARDCDEMLATFMRGQLTVMLSLGVIYSIGLWMAGLDLAILIGMLAGLVSFVPYLGVIVGLIAAGIAGIVQFHDLISLLPIILVFGVGQLLEGFVLTPLLVGDRIGLHPVAVIFAVMVGGQLFGFFGVLLALPVTAVLVVMLRFAHEQYLQSQIYESPE